MNTQISHSMFGRGAASVMFALAVPLLATAAFAEPPAQSPDIVELNNAAGGGTTSKTAAATTGAAAATTPAPVTHNILDALPMTLFKMGNSAYTGKAPLGYDIGTPTVVRTPTSFQLNTKIGPITIQPEAGNPKQVEILTDKARYEGTLTPTPDGKGTIAQTLNKKKTITFTPETVQSNGKSVQGVEIDMKGYVPLITLHVHLIPVS